MKWNLPIRKSIECKHCQKQFEITITRLTEESHTCPHCSGTATTELKAFEKEFKKQAADEIRKSLKRK